MRRYVIHIKVDIVTEHEYEIKKKKNMRVYTIKGKSLKLIISREMTHFNGALLAGK